MTDKVTEYMALPYVTEVVPEQCTDGSLCYRAYHPELPGCMSHGMTPQEAIENLAEARRLYIETLVEKGQPVPMPQRMITTSTGVSYQEAIWIVIETMPVEEERERIRKSLPEEVSPIRELAR